MPKKRTYFMESQDETLRLVKKTSSAAVLAQARWAGLHPGMRVADIGCGPGKTTISLLEAVLPGGTAVGVDASRERLDFARDEYAGPGIEFHCRNALEDLTDLGTFDFVWCRFLAEYYRSNLPQLLTSLDLLLDPGGILCVADLDYNCLTHYGLPERLEVTIQEVIRILHDTSDFDPYVGRKLYSNFYDMGYSEIDVKVDAHHLIFGTLGEVDRYNWEQKLVVGAQRAGCQFDLYPGGFDEFAQECRSFLNDPRRFTYTPLIICRGRKTK